MLLPWYIRLLPFYSWNAEMVLGLTGPRRERDATVTGPCTKLGYSTIFSIRVSLPSAFTPSTTILSFLVTSLL